MSTALKIVLSILLVLVIAAIFIITFLVNKKTKVPDNCPKAEIGCSGCMLNCSKREEEASIKDITNNLVSNFSEKDDKKPEEKKTEDVKEDSNTEERK